MSDDKNDDKNVLMDTKISYETVASQEEIYMEEGEEEISEILVSQDSAPSQNSGVDSPCIGESPEEPLNHAAEELITGDSDDPPLSEEEVAKLLSPS